MVFVLLRRLPIPMWVSITLFIVIVAIELTLLVAFVFPFVDSLIGPQEGTVGTDG